MSAAEWVGLDSTGEIEMSIGPVTLQEIYEFRETGGQNAPEHRVENGYEFTTRVGADPIELQCMATVNGEDLDTLRTLRHEQEPFTTSIGPAGIPACTLEDLRIIGEGQTPGAYRITVTIREVQQASTQYDSVRVYLDNNEEMNEDSGSDGGGPAPPINEETTSDESEGGWLRQQFERLVGGGDN